MRARPCWNVYFRGAWTIARNTFQPRGERVLYRSLRGSQSSPFSPDVLPTPHFYCDVIFMHTCLEKHDDSLDVSVKICV